MPAWRSSRRTGSALAPAGFAFLLVALAACVVPAAARADAPAPSYTRAYVALGAGAGLTITSFILAGRADAAYERYLAETDPARLEDAFQDAKRLDRISAAALIAGQAGLALGVYWRFLRHPRPEANLGVEAAPAPTWSLAPRATADGIGIAVDVRF